MAQTFQPPANLNDFSRSTRGQALFQAWHESINGIMTFQSPSFSTPAFFNPLQPPVNDSPRVATPEWTGLPRTIKRLRPGNIANAAQLVEESIAMGAPDPMEGQFTPPFRDAASGAIFPGPRYRPQDEYLEWVARRDADGVITEILFTCEGPEYWDAIASDPQLLLDLYRELVSPEVKLDDLLFPRAVTWDNPNGGRQRFAAGDYNPYNQWNIAGAVHLTQPANTLGAEINLARQASLLYGNPVPVTNDPALVCCAGYGGVNRMSDPTIGAAVNAAVRAGIRVSLRDPIGLYMKAISANVFTLPDNTPFATAADFFMPIRPSGGGEMIVRARFRVPDGETFRGRQLRVGDLKVNGETIVTGGQVADVITMRLFALTLPGAPSQQRRRCLGAPCPDRSMPEFIQVIPFGAECPPEGISPLALRMEAAVAHRAIAIDREEGELIPTGMSEKYAPSRGRRVYQ